MTDEITDAQADYLAALQRELYGRSYDSSGMTRAQAARTIDSIKRKLESREDAESYTLRAEHRRNAARRGMIGP